MNSVEIIEIQNVIIKEQSDVIDSLFKDLSQVISVEELDNLECIKKINHAAELRGLIRT